MTLTVACVFVKGPYPYTPEYVIRLERMVRKYLDRPFRFVCFTDQPEAFRDIETITITSVLRGDPEAIGYWNKLQLFNPAHNLIGRVMFLDLDVLVVSDLSPIADYPAPFALVTDELAREKPRNDVNTVGKAIIRQFNASAMVWYAGLQRDLYEKWTPAVTKRLQSDQDWYAERYPNATGMPVEWFPRISRVQPPWPADAKVVLVKTPKNLKACEKWPWFEAMWGGA
jgi:hypothetical protein